MLTASNLIARALRLINEPGRGARLSPFDQAQALEALQEVLDSEAVSKQFIPGIRRHFFLLESDKAVYTYGRDAAADFRSDDFDGDPAPIKIEDAYIRNGATITDNEVIDEYRFEGVGAWAVDADPDARITNNQYSVSASNTSTTQVVTPLAGTTYRLRINLEVFAGELEVRLRDSATAFETYVLDETGAYSFDFVWPSTVAPDVELFTGASAVDVRVNSLSIIERGRDRLELSQGSDYRVHVVDQVRYNRQFTKGTQGRPYELLFARDLPLATIRFDNTGLAGDVLVLDVLVNRAEVTAVSDEIRLQPDAIKWLRYALAETLAPEYGKELSPMQMRTMAEAWTRLAAGGRRMNNLSVDDGMRDRPRFDINRGDP